MCPTFLVTVFFSFVLFHFIFISSFTVLIFTPLVFYVCKIRGFVSKLSSKNSSYAVFCLWRNVVFCYTSWSSLGIFSNLSLGHDLFLFFSTDLYFVDASRRLYCGMLWLLLSRSFLKSTLTNCLPSSAMWYPNISGRLFITLLLVSHYF